MTPGRMTRADLGPTAMLMLAASVTAPVLADRLAWAFDLPPGLHLAMVVFAAAPVAQSAGSVAAMLGLPDRGATFAALATVLLAPLVLPAAVHLLLPDAPGLATDVLLRRAAILGLLPALLAFALRRRFPARVAAWRLDCRGLVLVALGVVAVAAGRGLRDCLVDPVQALHLGTVALAVMMLAMAGGWLLTRRFGREYGLAGLYACGARNLGFAWAAAAPNLDAEGLRFINVAVLLFVLLPMVMRRVMRRAAERDPRAVPSPLPQGAVA